MAGAGTVTLPVLLAGVLLVVGWWLPWIWGGPVPTRQDVEFDDRVGFAVPFAAGLLALVLAGLPRIGRPVRAGAWWWALALLGATGAGAVVALIDYRDGADFDSGVFLTVAGTLLAVAIGGRNALAVAVRPAGRRTLVAGGVAAVGGLLILDGVNKLGSTLGATAAIPSSVAGAVAVLAVLAHVARRPAVTRGAALLAATAGAFALGSAGMFTGEGKASVLLGGALAIAGGLYAVWALTRRAD